MNPPPGGGIGAQIAACRGMGGTEAGGGATRGAVTGRAETWRAETWDAP